MVQDQNMNYVYIMSKIWEILKALKARRYKTVVTNHSNVSCYCKITLNGCTSIVLSNWLNYKLRSVF